MNLLSMKWVRVTLMMKLLGAVTSILAAKADHAKLQ